MSIFYGYEVREKEGLKKELRSIFSMVWSYGGISSTSVQYPTNSSSWLPTTPIAYLPGEHTELEISSITFDSDQSQIDFMLEIHLKYVLADKATDVKIISLDLSQYEKYSIKDGRARNNCFMIKKRINFKKEIPLVYKDIRVFYVEIRYSGVGVGRNESRAVFAIYDV